jgi:hypothetical protein
MQLTEQHILTRNDSRFEAVDRAAFAAKNLYKELYSAAVRHVDRASTGPAG